MKINQITLPYYTKTEFDAMFPIVAFRGGVVVNQAISNTTWTKINFATEHYDYGGNFASSRFTAPYDGIYHFDASVMVTSASWSDGEQMYMGFYKNGVLFLTPRLWECQATNVTYITINGYVDLYLEAGDYIEVWTYHNRGPTTYIHAAPLNVFFNGHLVKKL